MEEQILSVLLQLNSKTGMKKKYNICVSLASLTSVSLSCATGFQLSTAPGTMTGTHDGCDDEYNASYIGCLSLNIKFIDPSLSIPLKGFNFPLTHFFHRTPRKVSLSYWPSRVQVNAEALIFQQVSHKEAVR